MNVEPIRSMQVIQDACRYLKKKNYKEFALFAFGIETLLRVSDILKFKWSDIYDRNGKLIVIRSINEQKTGKVRDVVINGNLSKILEKLRKENPDDVYVFQSESNRVKSSPNPWSRQYVDTFIKEACTFAGYKKNVGSHTMRKTGSYQLWKNGTDIYLIQKLLNHSRLTTTERYVMIDRDEMNEVMLKGVL